MTRGLPILLAGFALQGSFAVAADRAERIQFNRDIRPILSAKCFHCHGPDNASREAELRLDERGDAVAERGGYRVIMPGDHAQSELWRRISAQDADERMPPGESGMELTALERHKLRHWIEQGAVYEPHWSFLTPVRPSPPRVSDRRWPRNPIDAFVLARLEQKGIQPAPEAKRTTLLRRVTLDLTGLPPTIAEIDAFLADHSPHAFEAAVDRLMSSPRYGEHIAAPWLDAARYADTNGYFVDNDREMWQWRDWVIQAFNRNMPFDRFTVEQLAGDLLPHADQSQLIATGFNRNHMVTYESGIIDEEYRVEYVADRVDTTATVWLGLTVGCARCHDHKYDPLSQEEYYKLFAYFNNVPEQGNTGRLGNAPPVLRTPSESQQQRLDRLTQAVQRAQAKWNDFAPELDAAQREWEQQALASTPPAPSRGQTLQLALDGADGATAAKATGAITYAPGIVGAAARFDGGSVLEAASVDFDADDAISYGAWVYLTTGSPACVLSQNDDANGLRGFDLMVRKGKAAAHFIHRWSDSAIQVLTRTPMPRNRWRHVMVTYDGSGQAKGVRIYFDGKPQPLQIVHDSLAGTVRMAQPLRIGRRSTSAAFEGMIDDVRVYQRALSPDEVRRLATSQLVRGVLAVPANERQTEVSQKLREHFVDELAPERIRKAKRSLLELQARVKEATAEIPSAMVMQEREKRRPTFILTRGEYDRPGKEVSAGTPRFLPKSASTQPNRLGLAEWIVDPANPLTARVVVNRYWQHFFGAGIVATVEDFGSQGDWPSHPALLDWLATEFVQSGWDVKRLHRLIVTSATYRQSARTTLELRAQDPANRLLARGPRFRLKAETLRDYALATAGLLVDELGGPSVKPYQPAGLWEAVSYNAGQSYQADRGAALYRRSLYTFWKRQSPPANMLAFDSPTRETCTVRRSHTNTPLQALVLMNDPTFVEAARGIAQRLMLEAGPTPTEKIDAVFRLTTARYPTANERAALLEVYHAQREEYRRAPSKAQLLLSVGDSDRDSSHDAVELASWAVVAHVALTIDEAISKN